MSMSNSGSFAPKDSVLSSGHHGKPRKKRHRKKFRNSSLRKKKTKKSSPVRKTHFFKSNAPRINPNSGNIMSNWYWTNYKKAVEWQERHKVAHWKACALALMEENRYLLQIINDMRPGMVPKASVMQSNLGEHSNCSRNSVNSSGSFLKFNISGDYVNKNDDDDDDDDEDDEDVKGGDEINNDYEDSNKGIVDDDDDDGDIEFEMSEEMMQFFEQSYRHKMDLKKLKEKELLKRAEEEVKQMQMSKFKRSTEMNLLYGDGASMIIGMETAIQLSFDKYCDTKSPKYWPNIPFRL